MLLSINSEDLNILVAFDAELEVLADNIRLTSLKLEQAQFDFPTIDLDSGDYFTHPTVEWLWSNLQEMQCEFEYYVHGCRENWDEIPF